MGLTPIKSTLIPAAGMSLYSSTKYVPTLNYPVYLFDMKK